MRYSDAVSIPESWQQRPLNVRFNRVVSFDDEILREKQYRSFSSFHEEPSNTSSQISTISKPSVNINNNINCGLSYDSQTLHRNMRGRNHSDNQSPRYPNAKKANLRHLPPIMATPEPHESALIDQSKSSLHRSQSQSPSYKSHKPSFDFSSVDSGQEQQLYFHPGHSTPDSSSQSSRGTTLHSYAINPPQMSREIEERMHEQMDCIV